MNRIMRGVIHGRTIQLDHDIGLEDGQTVEVVVRTKSLPGTSQTAAGMMAPFWSDEDDRIMQEIYRDRLVDDRRELPD